MTITIDIAFFFTYLRTGASILFWILVFYAIFNYLKKNQSVLGGAVAFCGLIFLILLAEVMGWLSALFANWINNF